MDQIGKHRILNSETGGDIISLLVRTYHRYRGINGHIYAAAISYFSMISLFPWLIFIVTMMTLFVRDPVVQSQIISQVVEQFPPGARIRGELRAFVSEITVHRSGLLGVFGLVTTIIVASEAFRALRYALNTIFGITQQRSLLKGRAIDLLGMIVVLLFGSVSAAMTIFLRFDWTASVSPETSFIASVLMYALPFLLSFFAFVLMYRVVPEAVLDWRILWIPGLIAAIGFELSRLGIALFLNYFERFQQIYGALSVTVVALVFVFIVANIVLIAAALACEIDRDQKAAQGAPVTVDEQ